MPSSCEPSKVSACHTRSSSCTSLLWFSYRSARRNNSIRLNNISTRISVNSKCLDDITFLRVGRGIQVKRYSQLVLILVLNFVQSDLCNISSRVIISDRKQNSRRPKYMSLRRYCKSKFSERLMAHQIPSAFHIASLSRRLLIPGDSSISDFSMTTIKLEKPYGYVATQNDTPS